MKDNNPLSPHIQIYNWHISSLVSICHRITGIVNIVIITLICFWVALLLLGNSNYELIQNFFGTFFGMLPMLFIGCTLGSGLEKVIIENSATPTFLDIITAKDVYYPIFGFILVLILGIIIKRKLY